MIQKGRSLRGATLSLRHLATDTPLRAAVVVPKSVAKRAVDRNRVRRAVYSVLTPLSVRGTIVFFIHAVPKTQLPEVFSGEIAALLAKLK